MEWNWVIGSNRFDAYKSNFGILVTPTPIHNSFGIASYM
jgi:hypothetical protein